MRDLNILHLSDIHFQPKNYNQELIIEKLMEDLRGLSKGPTQPDLIVISGDLVKAGSAASHYTFFDDIILALTEVTKCSEKRIIICAGNHDAQRNYIQENLAEQQALLASLKSRDALNGSFFDGQLAKMASDKFSTFNELNDCLGGAIACYSTPMASVYNIDDLEVSLVTINTALFTLAGINKHDDKGHLLFPEAAIREALKHVKAQYKKILVHHHPFDWLQPHCAADLEAAIGNAFDLKLYGHMHVPKPAQIGSSIGTLLSNQSGALYQSRDYYDGYSLICHSSNVGYSAIHLRSYFESRQGFGAGEDIVPGGIWYSCKKAESYWSRKLKVMNEVSVRKWLSTTLLHETTKEYNEGLSTKPVCDVFVPPPMYWMQPLEEIEGATAKIDFKLEDFVGFDFFTKERFNAIVYAGEEYGKTTLLKQACLKQLQASEFVEVLNIPVYLEFSAIRFAGEKMLAWVLAGFSTHPEEDFSIKEALEKGLLTILVDDVDFADKKKLNSLLGLVNSYPKNRYIFTTLQPTGPNFGSIAAFDSAVSFKHIALRPFTRAAMRNMIQKWDADKRIMNHEQILNRLMKEIAGINLPITAVNGTILLSIYEEVSGFTPINRASLIEKFIETLLDKQSFVDAERSTFDFKHKTHFLAHLAAYMAQMNTYILPRQEVLDVFNAYLKKMGLKFDAEELLNSFITVKILCKKADAQISFKYRAFLEWFVAKQMEQDSKFKSWILEDSRYLSYINELNYYAGLVRNDVSLLNLIGERFLTLTTELSEATKWDADLNKISTLALPDPTDDAELFDEFERQLEAPALPQEDRDEILEGELPQDAEGRQEVFRPEVLGVGDRWNVALMLYSGILKNTELVADDIKRSHLAKVLNGWGLFTALSLYFVPLIAKHRSIKINGVGYQVMVPMHYTQSRVAHLIMVQMPLSISRLMFSLLGTDKLELQLITPRLEESAEPTIVRLYRHTLIVDLQLPGWLSSAKQLANNLGSRYLTLAFLTKLKENFYLGALKKDEQSALGTLITQSYASLSGKTGRDKANSSSIELSKMQKKLLQQSIKLSAVERQYANAEKNYTTEQAIEEAVAVE